MMSLEWLPERETLRYALRLTLHLPGREVAVTRWREGSTNKNEGRRAFAPCHNMLQRKVPRCYPHMWPLNSDIPYYRVKACHLSKSKKKPPTDSYTNRH